ncbi:hypothetical protein K9M79_01265 [Candidatus Woesearchaeota archaeon]|nr:hypothetical protein [Candidatus Woesearchaeota archaeon]
MTIHSIVSFFEKDDRGYVLATDSRVGGEQSLGWAEKAFFGKDHIGLVMGQIQCNGNGSAAQEVERSIRSLDDVFNNLQVGMEYRNIPVLNNSEYFINIAQRTKDNINLLWLTNIPGANIWSDTPMNTVMQRGSSIPKETHIDESLKGTSIYTGHDYAPIVGFCMEGNFYNFNKARAEAKKNVSYNPRKPEREMGKPQLYVVSFEKVERIE